MTHPAASCWALAPEVVCLNHGSFGACPRAVLQHQSMLRRRLERDPMALLVDDDEALLDAAQLVNSIEQVALLARALRGLL